MHVHVYSEQGEAKFWMEPTIELATNHRLIPRELRMVESIIREHHDEFIQAWHGHFSG